MVDGWLRIAGASGIWKSGDWKKGAPLVPFTGVCFLPQPAYDLPWPTQGITRMYLSMIGQYARSITFANTTWLG